MPSSSLTRTASKAGITCRVVANDGALAICTERCSAAAASVAKARDHGVVGLVGHDVGVAGDRDLVLEGDVLLLRGLRQGRQRNRGAGEDQWSSSRNGSTKKR